jgi:hypothetical protein
MTNDRFRAYVTGQDEGADAPAPEAEVPDSIDAIKDELEEHLTTARDYTRVLVRLDEGTFQDDESRCAVLRIGYELRDRLDKIEDLHGRLLGLLVDSRRDKAA